MRQEDELLSAVGNDSVARASFAENNFRRKMSEKILARCKALDTSPESLVFHAGITLEQVHRLVHKELGGGLELRTIFQAMSALGMLTRRNLKTFGEILASCLGDLAKVKPEDGRGQDLF